MLTPVGVGAGLGTAAGIGAGDGAGAEVVFTGAGTGAGFGAGVGVGVDSTGGTAITGAGARAGAGLGAATEAGGADTDGAAVTFNVKLVLCDRLPDPAVTVMGYVPAGADEEVVIFRVLKHVGAQLPWENDGVTPLGNPDADNETVWAAPLSSEAVIMVAPELACGNVTVPPFANEKSNAGVAGATAGAEGVGGGAGATGAGPDGFKTPLRVGALRLTGASAKREPDEERATTIAITAARSVLMGEVISVGLLTKYCFSSVFCVSGLRADLQLYFCQTLRISAPLTYYS